MEFPVYLLNYFYMTKYKRCLWKIITKQGKLLIPRKPPFADPSSHYWEDISRKVSIKWNGHLSYSWYLFQEEKINFKKEKKSGGRCSVQFSRSVVSDSLRPHELQHSRLPCPSPTPEVHPNSWPLSRWYHPAISSSVVPFSSCPQSLAASESFPMSQLLIWV